MGPMASSSRSSRPHRAPSSAGDTPSARTAARTSRRNSQDRARLKTKSSDDVDNDGAENETTGAVVRTGARVTRRLVALFVITAVLIISLISSLTVYVDQRQQIAQAREDIASSQQHIADLEAEQARWSDPDYVRAQARARLGWVMPGESGYQVIDESGNPYGGEGVAIDHTGDSAPAGETWWQRLWNSNEAADEPPETADPAASSRVVAPAATPSTGG